LFTEIFLCEKKKLACTADQGSISAYWINLNESANNFESCCSECHEFGNPGYVGLGNVGLGDVGLGDVGLGDVGLGDVGPGPGPQCICKL